MDTEALLFGVAFGVAGVVLLALGARKLRRAHEIRSNDPVSVRELTATASPLEFEGTVELPPDAEPLETPHSGEPAVCYEYRVREKRRRRSGSGNSRRSWRTVESGEESRPFVVADETGRVEVGPDGASLERSWETVDKDGSVELFGIDLNVDVSGPFGLGGSRPTKYQERRLAPGEEVHVYGASVAEDRAGWDSDVEASVAACEDASLYQLTVGGESAAVRSQLWSGLGLAAIGVVAGALGTLSLAGAV